MQNGCNFIRDQEVGGSNPLAPTNLISDMRGARAAPRSICYRFASTTPAESRAVEAVYGVRVVYGEPLPVERGAPRQRHLSTEYGHAALRHGATREYQIDSSSKRPVPSSWDLTRGRSISG